MITGRTVISRTSSCCSDISAKRRIAIAIVPLIVTISVLGLFRNSHRWRTWRPEEVPVAFWVWHSDCPGEPDVFRAVKEAEAQSLFLRAGQIDFEGGALRRIRAVNGRFPGSIDIHFVYNATPSCLAQFEKLSLGDLARIICKAYDEDISRAERDHARVVGVQ